ncbi:hypothetical protein Patl1_25605 [Pistacia atlantica]|uniref:Uncharacterized protein n=1 Tax=Pistacia atlantica TaxID=434234 RepID=A0ACC1AZP4_9ROSI|nr:hypothetical protein Patl1_25605 [Pistacia atlantica]
MVNSGSGIHGAVFPGCPETFQEESQSQSQSRSQHSRSERNQQSGEQHQKVRHIREGDIIALPAGVAHWIYNNGQSKLVLVALADVGNSENQLDQYLRKFVLGGSPQQEIQGGGQSWSQSRSSRKGQQSNNILSAFDEEILAQSFNIDTQLVKKFQREEKQRGIIVRVKEDLQLNINDPSRADVYNPRGGRVTSINALNLPILRFLQLSVEKGVLYQNAIMAPHWNMNAHSIVYITRGNGRMQIVSENGESVFDEEIREGQLVVVPQNFAVVKRASSDGFEWVSFKTNGLAKISQLGWTYLSDERATTWIFAQIEQVVNSQQQQQQQRFQTQCQIQNLNALEPRRRKRGLLVPSYNNAPQLVYVVQGKLITGVSIGAIFPACPETFQDESQSQSRSRFSRSERSQTGEQYQKVRHIREGDVIALPAGVAHWIYNNGHSRLVLVSLVDVGNSENQLDQQSRKFFLGGSPQQEIQDKNKNKNSKKEREDRETIIGLEETFCTMTLKHNINDPSRADVYNPHGGRVTNINVFNLSILRYLQLSAEKGVLYRNAILAPHWNLNAYSVVYVTRGNGRKQIVSENEESVFDEEIREGQLVVVPQN